MKENIYLPRMGQTMTEGVINKWLKKDGEKVQKGEVVVEITTDKVTTEIESPKMGLLRIIIKEDQTVPVGKIIGEILDINEVI
jgi:pyruvate dehydrogenase E2 component (dihydrolipoamide acetyltransferase)